MPRALLVYLPMHLVAALAGFGGVWAFSRALGADGYGVYALTLSGAALAHTLALTWVESAAFRFRARAVAKGWTNAHTAVLRQAWIGCALGLGAITLAAAALAPEGYRLAILAAGAWTLAGSAIAVRRETWRADGRAGAVSAVETARLAAGFALALTLTFTTDWGPAAPLVGFAIADAVAALALYVRRAGSTALPRAQLRLMRAYAAYALPLSAVLVMDIALAAGDRVVIAALLGAEAVGSYAAGYGLADKLVVMVFAAAGMAVGPHLVRAYDSGGPAAARGAAREAARLTLLVATPAAVGVAVVAPDLAAVVINPEFAARSAVVMPWVAAGAFLNGVTIHYLAFAFELTRSTRAQAVCVAAAAALNLALNLALIPAFGILGAAYATVIAYAAGALAFWAVGRGRLPLPLPWSDAVRVGLACAGMAGVVLSLDVAPGVAGLLLRAGVGAAVYGVLAAALNAGGVRAWLIRASVSPSASYRKI